MKTVDVYIEHCSVLIKENNTIELNQFYNELIKKNSNINFDIGYIYQKLFLKACLYGSKEILEWFLDIYINKMSFITRITHKHALVYGKYLIQKKRTEEIYTWYTQKMKEIQ